MHHILKTHPAMFRAARAGTKTFEVRQDDRAFQKGDTVELVYHDPNLPTAVPAPVMPSSPDKNDNRQPMHFRIGFVLRGGQYGIEPGYVAFSIETMPVTI